MVGPSRKACLIGGVYLADNLLLLHVRNPHCSFHAESSLYLGISLPLMSMGVPLESGHSCDPSHWPRFSELLYRLRFFLLNPTSSHFCPCKCQNCSMVFGLSYLCLHFLPFIFHGYPFLSKQIFNFIIIFNI